MIFSFLIEILIPFFHSLGNPKVRTLDYFFYASYIRHNFPYKLVPISVKLLKIFISYKLSTKTVQMHLIIGTTLEHSLQNSFLI